MKGKITRDAVLPLKSLGFFQSGIEKVIDPLKHPPQPGLLVVRSLEAAVADAVTPPHPLCEAKLLCGCDKHKRVL